MQTKTLLPADTYKVVNKTILTDYDRKILIAFYEPIIGPVSTSLYLTLWNDLEAFELLSLEHNHHHLLSILKCNLNAVKSARESLEALGLLKSYLKEGTVNDYIYELYSPLLPNEFLNHPVLNVTLFNNIGQSEYDRLKLMYQKIKVDTKDYEEITKNLDEVYASTNFITPTGKDVRGKKQSVIKVSEVVDYDLLISSMPKGIMNEKTLTKKTRELINLLSFIYEIDTLNMAKLIKNSLNDFGMIDNSKLRLTARKSYQQQTNTLPTLVHRQQPEFLKLPHGDNSKKGKIIQYFENTSPYALLKNKNKGSNPVLSELKIAEKLLVDFEMQPAVVNVLLDYVLKINNNKLSGPYVEAIASQWRRAGLETAKEAMIFAEQEHKKFTTKKTGKTYSKEVKKVIEKPAWFGEKIEKENVTQEEENELKELLKEFK